MRMRSAFTLVEVNLAMLVMAGGILTTVGLYALGFRESRQSAEDANGAALADSIIAPLVNALGSPEMTWDKFGSLGCYPSEQGWGAYVDNYGVVKGDPSSTAQSVYQKVLAQCTGANWSVPDPGSLVYGLVVMHDRDSAVVRIALRIASDGKLLMSAPLYYAEVRYQGP